jgi:hypothetical protein
LLQIKTIQFNITRQFIPFFVMKERKNERKKERTKERKKEGKQILPF